jgi:hypothetical protein
VTTSVVARVAQGSGSGAGLALIGFSSIADNSGAVSIFAHSGVTAPTTPVIVLDAYKHNGTTGRAALASTEIATQWRNGGSAVMTLLGGGSLGLGTTTPNAKAKLQVDSTTQGFLPPRMTTAQRDAITSVPAGLMIYNTDTNKLNVFTTAWEAVTSL